MPSVTGTELAIPKRFRPEVDVMQLSPVSLDDGRNAAGKPRFQVGHLATLQQWRAMTLFLLTAQAATMPLMRTNRNIPDAVPNHRRVASAFESRGKPSL